MHCDGKCYLKKELDRDARQDKNTGRNKERYEVMFVNALPVYIQVPVAAQVAHVAFYTAPSLETPASAIFHPPKPLIG